MRVCFSQSVSTLSDQELCEEKYCEKKKKKMGKRRSETDINQLRPGHPHISNVYGNNQKVSRLGRRGLLVVVLVLSHESFFEIEGMKGKMLKPAPPRRP